MAAFLNKIDEDLSDYLASRLEADASFEGETGLKQKFKTCSKNPGHEKFIPVEDFTLDHLPPEYREQDLFDCVQAMNILTCRLSVEGASQNRPKFFPGSSSPYPNSDSELRKARIAGTGWIASINVTSSGDDCYCKTCVATGRPPKERAKLIIFTANHVVYNKEEALRTTCHFFFNKGPRPDKCDDVVSLSVSDFESVVTEADRCSLIVYTHDIQLAQRFIDARDKLREKALKLSFKFDGRQAQTETEDSNSIPKFLTRLMINFNRLYKAYRSVSKEMVNYDLSDLTIVSLDELKELEKKINDFQIEFKEQRDFTRLFAEITNEFGETKRCLEQSKTVFNSLVEYITLVVTTITNSWHTTEKKLLKFLSVLENRIFVIFKKYQEDSDVPKITHKIMIQLLNGKQVFFETLLNDMRVFLDLIKRDLLVLRKVFDTSDISKEINESLMKEIDDLEFTLIECRCILLDDYTANTKKIYLYNSDNFIEQLEKCIEELELGVAEFCNKSQELLKKTSTPETCPQNFPNLSAPQILKSLIKIRILYLNMFVHVRSTIISCARNVTCVARSKLSTPGKEVNREKRVGNANCFINDLKPYTNPVSNNSKGDPITENTRPLVIIVSHPHGASKHVTVGYLDTITEVDFDMNNIQKSELIICMNKCMVSYTTATCPGSSGSLVFVLNSRCCNFVMKDAVIKDVILYSDCTHSGSCGHRNNSIFSTFIYI